MALKDRAGPRQLRVLMRELEEIVDDGSAGRAIIAHQHLGGAQMQLLDGCEPRQAERLARDHDDQSQCCGSRKGRPEQTKAFAARKQVFDQIDDAKPEAKQHEPSGRSPEQRAPAETAPHRHQRRLNDDRQQRRIGFRRDANRAAGGAGGILRIHHDHCGIIQPEGRRPPMRRFLAHCSLSPIRNCSARSRRM